MIFYREFEGISKGADALGWELALGSQVFTEKKPALSIESMRPKPAPIDTEAVDPDATLPFKDRLRSITHTAPSPFPGIEDKDKVDQHSAPSPFRTTLKPKLPGE